MKSQIRMEKSYGTRVAGQGHRCEKRCLVQTSSIEFREILMRKMIIVIACSCLGVLSAAAGAQTQAASVTAENSLPQADKDFVQAASMSSSTEIDAAKLASRNSSDKDVKSFAHHMMLDHTKLTAELKMAAPHGVTVPKDNADTTVLDALKPLKGKEFDQAYIRKVGLEGHQAAIAAFEKEIADGQNAHLKKAAQKALPIIQGHYKMAQDLAAKKGVAAQ
jgi:putative membrane protein